MLPQPGPRVAARVRRAEAVPGISLGAHLGVTSWDAGPGVLALPAAVLPLSPES